MSKTPFAPTDTQFPCHFIKTGVLNGAVATSSLSNSANDVNTDPEWQMSISMLIENRHTGQSEEIPICTNAKFHAFWERAAVDERLEMIQALGGLWITREYHDQFLSELGRLKAWAAVHATTDEYFPEMIQCIDEIMNTFSSHPLDDYEISFG